MKHAKLNLTRFSAIALTLTLAACSGSGDSQSGSSSTSDMNQNNDDSAVTIPVGNGGDLNANTIDESNLNNGQNGSDVVDSSAVELQNVFYFDYDKSTLSQETRDALDVQASILAQTGGSIILEGYTDDRGTREYNMALGERRAKAVASYLKIRGVNASQIEVISFGEEKPAVEGNNPAAWAQNRRVELK